MLPGVDNGSRARQAWPMGGRMVAVGVAIVALAWAASAMGGPARWRVIGHGSASGDFAVAAARGTAKHPHQLAVKVVGRGARGFAVVACSKGFGIGSKSTSWHGTGLHLLKVPMAGSDSCDVTASAAGSGKVSLQIVAR